MTIRTDNRGYMRAVIALRKAFKERMERRRVGEDGGALMDEAFIILLRDVLGDGGWATALSAALLTGDERAAGDIVTFLTGVRRTLREQGLLGWILRMAMESDRALDMNEPSPLMLDVTPMPENTDDLNDEELKELSDSLLTDDMMRFHDDARRIGASLLLRWAEDDRDAVRLSRLLLSARADEAYEDITRDLLDSGGIDDERVLDDIDAWYGDIADPQRGEREAELARLRALAEAERRIDPLWAALNGEDLDPETERELLETQRARLGHMAETLLAPADRRDASDGMSDDASPQDESDQNTSGQNTSNEDETPLDDPATRRFHEADLQYAYDVYRAMRGHAELQDLRRSLAGTIPAPGADADDQALADYLGRVRETAQARREAYLAERYPERVRSPWLHEAWLDEATQCVLGGFDDADELQDLLAADDMSGFTACAELAGLRAAMALGIGLLRMPAVMLMRQRSMVMEDCGDDPELLAHEVERERLRCADQAMMLLHYVPDRRIARSLALALLQGDLSLYAARVDEAYAGGTPQVETVL